MATTSNALTNWFEEYVLRHFFGITALNDYTSSQISIRLHSADPGEDGTSSELDNTNEPGYAPQYIDKADFTVQDDGNGGFEAVNNNTIEWTATGAWINAPTHFSAYCEGNLQPLFVGAIDDGAGNLLTALSASGKKLQITANSLKLRLS